MVKTVKTSLRIAFRLSSLSEKEMEATIIEIESLVNCRPLTYISADRDDPQPLCPADFLFCSGLATMDPPVVTNPSNLRRSLLLKQRTEQAFWNRWTKEYLTALQKWRTPSDRSSATPKVNQVVLVKSKAPCRLWPLARITAFVPGRDGLLASPSTRVQRLIYPQQEFLPLPPEL